MRILFRRSYAHMGTPTPTQRNELLELYRSHNDTRVWYRHMRLGYECVENVTRGTWFTVADN